MLRSTHNVSIVQMFILIHYSTTDQQMGDLTMLQLLEPQSQHAPQQYIFYVLMIGTCCDVSKLATVMENKLVLKGEPSL